MLRNNKKAYSTGLFGFFFVLMIIAAVFFFGTFVMHYLLYDYGMVNVVDVAQTIVGTNTTAMNNINTLATGYLDLIGYYDILFLVLIISAFIESTVAAVKMREAGYLSFFGFITIGNVFLIFIMNYAVQVQGWLMNEIVYDVLLVSVDSPVMTMFFNYGMYIGVFWYLWLIAVNQIDFGGLKERVSTVFGRRKLTTEEGRFEE